MPTPEIDTEEAVELTAEEYEQLDAERAAAKEAKLQHIKDAKTQRNENAEDIGALYEETDATLLDLEYRVCCIELDGGV